MALSQNGYTVPLTASARSSTLTYIAVPGGRLEVRKGDAAVVFSWFAAYYNAHVQRLQWPGQWGFFARPIRGMTTGYSNHASGTAIDLNAPLHPRDTRASSNFSSVQVAEIRKMLAYCDGVIRWGADYQSAPPDPMHFEINADAARVHALALKIQAASKPAPKPPARKVDKMQYRLIKLNGVSGDFASNGIQAFWVGPGAQRLKDLQYQMTHFDGAVDTVVGEYTKDEFDAFMPGGLVGPLPPGWGRNSDGTLVAPVTS